MDEQQLLKQQQRERILLEYRHKIEKLTAQRKGKLTYPNQQIAAQQVIEHYVNGKYLVLLVAQPGAGKTGVVLEVTKQMATHPDDNYCIDAENVYMISGMSDNDWQSQFKDKMLPSFQTNVYHRGCITKIEDKITQIKNGMVITDECHVASGKQMLISKMLTRTGLTDIDVARSRNVKLLEVSATPETVAYDIERWGDASAIVMLEPGESYKGFQVMLDENRIREANLKTYEDVNAWFAMFDTRYQQKKYYPVRVRCDELKGHFERAIVEFGWRSMIHNATERIDEIDEMMLSSPEHNTIIFIKGFWRASKRLNRKHVGGCYEEIPKTQNTTSASQGLIARFCDTYEYSGDELNPDLRPIHFGDIESVKVYLNWFNSGCDFGAAEYNSTRISSNGTRVTKAAKSKVHHSNMSGINLDMSNNDGSLDTDKDYKLFDTQDEARDFGKSIGVKFNRRTSNNAVKELQTNGINPTCEELIKRMWGINHETKARMIPTNDGKWCVYWRPSLIVQSPM